MILGWAVVFDEDDDFLNFGIELVSQSHILAAVVEREVVAYKNRKM